MNPFNFSYQRDTCTWHLSLSSYQGDTCKLLHSVSYQGDTCNLLHSLSVTKETLVNCCTLCQLPSICLVLGPISICRQDKTLLACLTKCC